MKKVLTITATLCLFFTVSVGGVDFRKSGPDTAFKETIIPAFFDKDTIKIIHETFSDNLLDGWTEVGGGEATGQQLKVTVSGGGSDYIQKTIPSCDEYRYVLRFFFTDADTADWDDGESIVFSSIKQSDTDNGYGWLAVVLDSGSLKWRISYKSDLGATQKTLSTTTLSTNTWYNLVWHIKKATSSGADNGISNLSVDGVVNIINVTAWDNDATNYELVRAGRYASSLNAIYYIDDVKLWSPEGLP